MAVIQRYAWSFLFGLGVLLALFSTYLVLVGVDPDDFQSSTGVAWSAMQASQPEVARYLVLDGRLLGATLWGFGFLGAVVAWKGFRKLERWAWYTMWAFPVIFAVYALIFAFHAATALASTYAVIAVLSALAVVLPVRKFF